MKLSNRNRIKRIVGLLFTALLLALALLPDHFFNAGGQSNFSVEFDTDRGGSDYKNFDLAEANHEVCRNYCAADSTCRAYTYTKPEGNASAHCWLKNSVSTPVPYRTCCISGVKGAAFNGDSGMGSREDNMSLMGTNLSYYARPAFETCQSDCMNNGKCKGFTWIQAGTYNPNDPAMCYLMSAISGRSPARGHYSGVKGPSVDTGGDRGGNNAADFAGAWNAGIDGYSFFMVLQQQGNRVAGTLDGPSGTIQGDVTGRTLRFRFNYKGNTGAGSCVLSDDGKSYKGFFGNSDNPDDRSRGYWNGTKR